jgi:hypothetical protein
VVPSAPSAAATTTAALRGGSAWLAVQEIPAARAGSQRPAVPTGPPPDIRPDRVQPNRGGLAPDPLGSSQDSPFATSARSPAPTTASQAPDSASSMTTACRSPRAD